MKIKLSPVFYFANRLIHWIKIGLTLLVLTALTGCIGFVGEDGYYGDRGYVGGWWWGDGGWWGGGDRGHDAHRYSVRGAGSRGFAHGGGGHAGGGHSGGGGGRR
jgi:hypothetical protein